MLKRTIPLQDSSGHPYSGLVNSQNPTGEIIEDLGGHDLAQDPNGYDSEGLVALPDGTFWVSDEYGPFITHFSRDGGAIQRLSPLDGSLPKELVNRVPNRGREGLTITPDGKTLVGMMQSALQQTDLAGKNAKGVAVLNGGKQIVISNDSDFGISGVTNSAPPWQLQAKIDPATGQQDDGEYLSIDTTKLGAGSTATTSTATVTIHVTSG